MNVLFMKITATELRQNIYQLLDSILNTGVPLEIERNGKLLKIVAESPPSKLENLTAIPNLLNCSWDEIENIDWSKEWQHDLP